MTMDVFPDNGTREASGLKTSQDGKTTADLEPEPLTPAVKDQFRDFRCQNADDSSPVTPSSSSRLAKAMLSRKAFMEGLSAWNGGTDLDLIRVVVMHRSIDLYELFQRVVRSGGPGALIDQRAWTRLARTAIYGNDADRRTGELNTSVAYTIRQIYNKYLHGYLALCLEENPIDRKTFSLSLSAESRKRKRYTSILKATHRKNRKIGNNGLIRAHHRFNNDDGWSLRELAHPTRRAIQFDEQQELRVENNSQNQTERLPFLDASNFCWDVVTTRAMRIGIAASLKKKRGASVTSFLEGPVESTVSIEESVQTIRLAAVASSSVEWTRDLCLTLSACKKILLKVSPTDPNHPYHSGTDPGDRTRRKRFGKGRVNKSDDGDFFWPRIGNEYQADISPFESPTTSGEEESLSAHNNERHRLLWKSNGEIDNAPPKNLVARTGRILRNGRHHKRIDYRVIEASEKLELEVKSYFQSERGGKVDIDEAMAHLGVLNIGARLVSKWSDTDHQDLRAAIQSHREDLNVVANHFKGRFSRSDVVSYFFNVYEPEKLYAKRQKVVSDTDALGRIGSHRSQRQQR